MTNKTNTVDSSRGDRVAREKKGKRNRRKIEKLYHLALKLVTADPPRCLILCYQLVRLRPDHPDIYRVMGLAYVALGQPEMALQAYDRGLLIARYNMATWLAKGELLLHLHGLDGGDLPAPAITAAKPKRMPITGGPMACLLQLLATGQGMLMEVSDWLPDDFYLMFFLTF